MQKIFLAYRSVIINAVILLALATAIMLNNSLMKDFFIGLGTGLALVSFGKSIADAKHRKNNKYITDQD